MCEYVWRERESEWIDNKKILSIHSDMWPLEDSDSLVSAHDTAHDEHKPCPAYQGRSTPKFYNGISEPLLTSRESRVSSRRSRQNCWGAIVLRAFYLWSLTLFYLSVLLQKDSVWFHQRSEGTVVLVAVPEEHSHFDDLTQMVHAGPEGEILPISLCFVSNE